MSGCECENILPSDATLLYRARGWSKLFMKYNKDTLEEIDIFNENDSYFSKLIEEGKGENDDGDDDAAISDPDFVGSSSGDTNDNADEVKNLLDKTLKVIEKRKDQWEKTGINNVLDTFCLEEIDNKVNAWLKTNENYLKLSTNKINSNNNNENIKMTRKSKRQAEMRRNQSLNLNRSRRIYDEDSSSSSTNNSDENFNVTNNNRKLNKKYRMKNNKNKSYVLSSSLESVDTAQYILSSRKPYNKMKTKTNNMKIKRFCNTKNYQDKAEKHWKKLKLKSGSGKSNKLSVVSVPLLSSRQHQIRKRKKILVINDNNDDNEDESDYDDSSENDIEEEETDSDGTCVSNGEKCYLIPKRYFKGSSHSHDKKIKSKNLHGGGSDYHHYHHHDHKSDTAVAIIKSADYNLINRQSTNHRNKMKSLKKHKCRGNGGGGGGEEAAISNKSLLYNSNLMYNRRTPSPQVSHINEIRLTPPLPSSPKSPSQNSFFNDDLISENFNPDKHSTEISNFSELNLSMITNFQKKNGCTKLRVINSPLSFINKTIQSSRNSNTENSCNISICSTRTSRISSKMNLTKTLLEETIGKNYAEQIFNYGEIDLTKFQVNTDSEVLFEPPPAEKENYKPNNGNCNDDDDEHRIENSDDALFQLYRPNRGRIYEFKSLESSPLSTPIKRK